MRSTKTEKRLEKITRVISSRQHSLTVVMENIHDPHNVSAIFRTCDAVGIPKVNLVYNYESFPRIGKKSSASAFKWVDKEKYNSIDECYSELRKNGFKILASSLSEKSKNLYDLDLTQKTAIVVGNEHRGVSDEAANSADETFLIPQFGMVQSLNVSVATAVIMYEAMRQRWVKGMYDKSELDDKTLEQMIDNWCEK
ncbi:MAG: RNA methyltransferase [Ignavibacteriaceae bacterium]|nr:RNA methyltransferase [Ignavibacterium sp.]MCC6256434.1 RNA methyltransferase [Ignavibacteriaceae bacterium]HRN26474.1 TrmH family RNA methyltransferase [Ignavibacteriaceae bacterium]HRP92060.1 TrmH family RNA methyltransferase [Ignavibacteriaceae bacterium]HRQ53901.1 TrmH family RNA methyltransferase [Ignavibacteriaceae bacterium]